MSKTASAKNGHGGANGGQHRHHPDIPAVITPRATAPVAVDKHGARLNVIRHVLNAVEYPGKDAASVGTTDPAIPGTPDILTEDDRHPE